jgi:hypothetical protein
LRLDLTKIPSLWNAAYFHHGLLARANAVPAHHVRPAARRASPGPTPAACRLAHAAGPFQVDRRERTAPVRAPNGAQAASRSQHAGRRATKRSRARPFCRSRARVLQARLQAITSKATGGRQRLRCAGSQRSIRRAAAGHAPGIRGGDATLDGRARLSADNGHAKVAVSGADAHAAPRVARQGSALRRPTSCAACTRPRARPRPTPTGPQRTRRR